VSLHAEEAMGDRPPILKPVFASLTFFRQTDNCELLGKVWFNGVEWSEKKEEYVKTGETVPDSDNLAKGTLDAMQAWSSATTSRSVSCPSPASGTATTA
jgi:hypothetical protein